MKLVGAVCLIQNETSQIKGASWVWTRRNVGILEMIFSILKKRYIWGTTVVLFQVKQNIDSTQTSWRNYSRLHTTASHPPTALHPQNWFLRRSLVQAQYQQMGNLKIAHLIMPGLESVTFSSSHWRSNNLTEQHECSFFPSYPTFFQFWTHFINNFGTPMGNRVTIFFFYILRFRSYHFFSTLLN